MTASQCAPALMPCLRPWQVSVGLLGSGGRIGILPLKFFFHIVKKYVELTCFTVLYYKTYGGCSRNITTVFAAGHKTRPKRTERGVWESLLCILSCEKTRCKGGGETVPQT